METFPLVPFLASIWVRGCLVHPGNWSNVFFLKEMALCQVNNNSHKSDQENILDAGGYSITASHWTTDSLQLIATLLCGVYGCSTHGCCNNDKEISGGGEEGGNNPNNWDCFLLKEIYVMCKTYPTMETHKIWNISEITAKRELLLHLWILQFVVVFVQLLNFHYKGMLIAGLSQI